MVLFSTKFHFYVDKATLEDPACVDFFTDLATRHCEMYLVLHDIWELEEVKQLEQYGFICDVVYGHDELYAIQRKMEEKNQKKKMVVFISNNLQRSCLAFDVVSTCLGNRKGLQDMLTEKEVLLKKKARWIYSVLAVCILYFVLYFMNLENLPIILVEGCISFLFFIIPAMILLFTFFYALYCGVFRWSLLLSILDIF